MVEQSWKFEGIVRATTKPQVPQRAFIDQIN
jgi:hypothetical protein